MIHFAAALYHFLRQHNIDHKKVAVVLRAEDAMTFACLESAVRRSLDSLIGDRELRADGAVRRLKIHGLSISLTSLDASR